MGEKEILSITDAAELDAHINSLMECKLLSEEDVESLCKRVSRAREEARRGEREKERESERERFIP